MLWVLNLFCANTSIFVFWKRRKASIEILFSIVILWVSALPTEKWQTNKQTYYFLNGKLLQMTTYYEKNYLVCCLAFETTVNDHRAVNWIFTNAELFDCKRRVKKAIVSQNWRTWTRTDNMLSNQCRNAFYSDKFLPLSEKEEKKQDQYNLSPK